MFFQLQLVCSISWEEGKEIGFVREIPNENINVVILSSLVYCKENEHKNKIFCRLHYKMVVVIFILSVHSLGF